MDLIDIYFDDQRICNNKVDEVCLGIDLGTSNSCISIWRNNNVEIIPNKKGNKFIPSIISVLNDILYVGTPAKNQIMLNNSNTIYETKRFIGKKFNDISVQNDKKFITYNINEDNNGDIIICTNSKIYSPEDIACMILKELKYMAEDYLGYEIKDVIVTVPAYFNDLQRDATKIAADMAGLNCIRILNEPTAAALAYGIHHYATEEKYIIVYDLGGGTLDVSLLNICDGTYDVISSCGNTHLGGLDFDNRLYWYVLNQFLVKNNITNGNINMFSLQKLKTEVEYAKRQLSTNPTTKIAIKNFHENIDLCIVISKELFENICADLFMLCIKPLQDIIYNSGIEITDINEIVLVGGATKIPKIKKNIKQFVKSHNKNIIINDSLNPDEVVCIGAAIQGYILKNPDNAFSSNITLLDSTPLSIGIETMGGVMFNIIDRGTHIPVKKTALFTTEKDNQTTIILKIYEGERQLTKDNYLVGQFELSGIEKLPKGCPKIKLL